MQRAVVVNDVSMNVIADPDFWFWSAVHSGRWEPQTFAVMDRLLKPDWRFIDIGAWIGPTTLYAANKCATVDAYECDPVAIHELKINLMANPDIQRKVALREYGLGSDNGFVKIYSRILGNSETSIFQRHERNGEIADCAISLRVGMRNALDVFREMGYANCAHTLIKMDVEGAEYDIIRCLSELIPGSRCTWYISLHPINLNPVALPAKYLRIAETIKLLCSFENLAWYGADFHLLKKEEVLHLALTSGLPFDSMIFVSSETSF